MSLEVEELPAITEALPVTSPPAGDCDRPRRKRGRRRGRRRNWALLVLTLTAVTAACVSALSIHRVQVLRAELSALRSELYRQREEEHGGATQQQAGKPEDLRGERLHSSSAPEPHNSMHNPKSQQVLQPCLQMIGDRSRSTMKMGRNTALPWQVGVRRGTAVQEKENGFEVTEGGVYFIYSQVYYTDKIYVMGHILQRKQMVLGGEVREDILFRCIQNMDRNHPHNTCYTGGIARLKAGDQIELLIPRTPVNVSLDGDTTFFGAVRLA